VLVLNGLERPAGVDCRSSDTEGCRHGRLDDFLMACEADVVVISDRIDLIPVDVAYAVVDLALKGASICTLSQFLRREHLAPGGTPEPDVMQRICSVIAASERTPASRRVVEMVVSGFCLLLTLPVMALIALAVKMDSPGPVLFVQERLGRFKVPFRCIKFRTMSDDAECATGPVWASENDDRTTRIGRFLRRSRLDELPQLINVLRGDMSLIGARPIRRYFADLLAVQVPFYDLRFLTKPGITGLAQVKQSYPSTVAGQIEKFHLDLFYLRHRSLKLDLNIVLLTGWTFLRMTGK
jgi:lipopolysaccharide/colanic/teichoic acid biosynthesis glycosyltransferase